MADNQPGSKKKAGRKKKIKDGVVLKVSDIEKECDRLRRRPRAALYPLLPITEPLKLKSNKKLPPGKAARRRHRKHCRKRLGIKRRPLLTSRSKLVTSESTSCSKNRQHLLLRPHWGSLEDIGTSSAAGMLEDNCLFRPPRHHHYHPEGQRQKHRICHHDPLICGHRTSMTTSLQDLRDLSLQVSQHQRRRIFVDPETGDLGKDENARSRKIVSFVVASVASFILMMCVALVAVTLRLTPAIDELVRKGNEEIYRSITAGASTSSPATEGSVVVNNTTAPPSGTPG